MQLSDGHRSALGTTGRRWSTGRWAIAAIALGLAGVFVIDRATGTVPFQHLYYLPIILAAQWFGLTGAWVSSCAAVTLYHVANPALLALAHTESDVVQVALFVVVGLATARLRKQAIRLEALAGTDDLTGLHNLRGFEQRLRSCVRDTRRAHTALSMLVVDLDRLKALNDKHGHLAGAEAVRTVGHIIASRLPEAAFACRYGGDEFAIALPGRAAAAAEDAASAILQSVCSAAPVLAGIAFPPNTLSVSIGVACLNGPAGSGVGGAARDDDAGEALFRAADAALYEAKRSGRSRICAA